MSQDAEECITQVGLKRPEVAAFFRGFLDRQALTRVCNCVVDTVPGLVECLEDAFGHKCRLLDMQKQLKSCVQRQVEGVWDFAGSLGKNEKNMQCKRARSDDNRKWLCTLGSAGI